MDDASDATGPHVALAVQLQQRGYRARHAGVVLLVVGLAYEGGPRRLVTVIRTRRPSDGDRWWYRVQNRAWLAEADRPVDAALALLDHLTPLHPVTDAARV